MGRIGSEDRIGLAKRLGDDRRKREGSIKALADKLPKPALWLFSVSDECNCLDGGLLLNLLPVGISDNDRTTRTLPKQKVH
jgi:hypothetical protein